MRRLLAVASIAVLGALSSPARAQLCPGVSPWVFDDVLASDPFCGFVTWMAENGVTLGCLTIDANHRLYCPAQTVNRLQMAAFMKRLGDVRVEAVATGPGLLGGRSRASGRSRWRRRSCCRRRGAGGDPGPEREDRSAGARDPGAQAHAGGVAGGQVAARARAATAART